MFFSVQMLLQTLCERLVSDGQRQELMKSSELRLLRALSEPVVELLWKWLWLSVPHLSDQAVRLFSGACLGCDVFSAADCDHSRRADGDFWWFSVLLWSSRTVLWTTTLHLTLSTLFLTLWVYPWFIAVLGYALLVELVELCVYVSLAVMVALKTGF